LYVDFIPGQKDDKPFYFDDAHEKATFSNNPSRGANGIWWDAMLSLVGVKGLRPMRLCSSGGISSVIVYLFASA
jgi:hypothetical protein